MKELSFRTTARHVGQLGRELVTDFVTALVELIKNAYDADSPSVRIEITDTKNGAGNIMITDSGSGMTIDEFENKWMVIGTSNKLSEPYTPKGRRKAGKKGIGRFSVERLAEQITLYSFPSDNQPFTVSINWNRYEEIDVEAIRQRISILRDRPDRDAAKFISGQIQYALLSPSVGEADKAAILRVLGEGATFYKAYFEPLMLHTLEQNVLPILKKYEGQQQLIEEIKSPLLPIGDLDSCPEYVGLKQLFAKSGQGGKPTGVVMVLKDLRDEWTQKSIDKLQKELRLLVAPDLLREDNSDSFHIELEAPEFVVEPEISVNDILGLSFATVKASVSDSGRVSRIEYSDNNGIRKERRHLNNPPLHCGDLTFELYYFLRDAEHLKNEGYQYRYAIRVLDTYCGIKIYRDQFRVKPYGDPGNDWLYLDRDKVKDTHGYLVGNNQTIGRINISDISNPLLVDATNREGIIENAAFEQLREFVKECIGIITAARKEEYEKRQAGLRRLDDEHAQIVKRGEALKKEAEQLEKDYDVISAYTASGSGAGSRLLEDYVSRVHTHQQKQADYQGWYADNAEQRYQTVQEILDYKDSELNMYKNLATLGMLAGEFGHETSDIVNRVQTSAQTVVRALRGDPRYVSSLELLEIIKDDFRRISSYSEMIVAFLKKKKRESTGELQVKAVAEGVCRYYKDILDEFNIDFALRCEDGIVLTIKQIDLESIIINMLTNAYAQLKKCETRKIGFTIWQDPDAIRMTFEDSGPGVPEEDRERIFEPFYSTKEDGVGLGLSIVKDIVSRYNGKIKCAQSKAYGGASFLISFFAEDDVDE